MYPRWTEARMARQLDFAVSHIILREVLDVVDRLLNPLPKP